MENQIENEQDKLSIYLQICADALKDYAINHPFELTAVEKEQIIRILKRMFDAETDFLLQEPEAYFELYSKKS